MVTETRSDLPTLRIYRRKLNFLSTCLSMHEVMISIVAFDWEVTEQCMSDIVRGQ